MLSAMTARSTNVFQNDDYINAMTWARKGNALHVKSAKSFNNRVLPLLVGPQGDSNIFRANVSKHLYF
jgi:hypothetical protein